MSSTPTAASWPGSPPPRPAPEPGSAPVLEAWAGLGYNRRARPCTRPPWPSSSATAGGVPTNSPCPAGVAGRRGLHRPGGPRLRLRAPRGRRGRQRGAGAAPSRGRGAACPGLGRRWWRTRSCPGGRAWEWNQAIMEIGARCVHGPGPGVRIVSAVAVRALGQCRRATARPGTGGRVRQTRFEGSDRQGRGRLVDALRSGPVPAGRLRGVCGWPEDPEPGPTRRRRPRRRGPGSSWTGQRAGLALTVQRRDACRRVRPRGNA